MRRAIATLALSWIAAGVAHAQTAGDTLLTVRPRPVFTWDAVLFRLPRANVPSSGLVALELRPIGRRYYFPSARVNGALRGIEIRCLYEARSGTRRETFTLSMKTDSATVYVLRPASSSCDLRNRAPWRASLTRAGEP